MPMKAAASRVELPAEPPHDRERLRGVRDRMKSKDMRFLNRREFNGLCVALGPFAAPIGAAALDAATGAASTGAGRTVKFRDGTVIPALGQGSARLGKGRHILKLLKRKRYAPAFRSEWGLFSVSKI